jgi:hypothetical protein
MSYTPTKHIMRRVEAALEFDLLGATNAATAAHDDANGGLDSLNPNGVVESVSRYLVDVLVAGDVYATTRGTGITVGYSLASDMQDRPTSLNENALGRILDIEVSPIGIIDSMDAVTGSERGEQFDDLMDDIKRIFGAGRRDGTNFGVQTQHTGDIQKLEGGGRQAPWVGQTIPISFRRSERDLQT